MPLHLPLSQSFPNSPPGQMLAGSWLYMPREKYTLPTSVNTPRASLIFLKEAWESLAKAGRAVLYTSEACGENTDCSTELTQDMPQGSQLWGQSKRGKHCLVCWDTQLLQQFLAQGCPGLAERSPSSLGLEMQVINQSDKGGKATSIATFCQRRRKSSERATQALSPSSGQLSLLCLFPFYCQHFLTNHSLRYCYFIFDYNKDPVGFPKLFSFKNIFDMVQGWRAFSTLWCTHWGLQIAVVWWSVHQSCFYHAFISDGQRRVSHGSS